MAVQDTIRNGVWNMESAKVFEKASNFVHIYVKSGGSSPALSGAYLKQTHVVSQENVTSAHYTWTSGHSVEV